ncbi:MAG: ribonuclease J [Rhodospirillales bacterium]|nr:ribonuclease J [Rhodospirillales bacterium]
MIKAKPELVFVPLGGAGEIGMNLNLYGLGPADDRRWLMVDCGITFGDEGTPGIDVILPDPKFIEEQADRLEGILLTHGHEDHLGAVPYLGERLQCPVYATPFTLALLRRKLEMDGLTGKLDLREIPLGDKFYIGPFSLEMIKLTHSMPEPNAVVLRTELGTVLHSGDWKLDPDPVIEEAADEEALRRLGEEGVMTAVVDSTNIFKPDSSGSEADLLESLTEIIGTCSERVAVACFASNVARLHTIFEAASANGRAVALVGRSLWRINGAARETGYLDHLPPFLEAEDTEDMPKDRILYICTGSQGEPRAALTRIANDSFRSVTLEAGDAVIYSSRVIPGNEMSISRIQNRLAKKGVRVITSADHFTHVSGHPAEGEVRRFYDMVQPGTAIPVHGETRHMARHAEVASDCGVQDVVTVKNGDMVRLAPGPAQCVGEVPVGRLYVDGKNLRPMNGKVRKQRSKVLYNGAAMLSLVLDDEGDLLADPQFSSHGLLEGDEENYTEIEISEAVRLAIEDMPVKRLSNDEAVREATRKAVRRCFEDAHGKRPVISVHLVRV